MMKPNSLPKISLDYFGTSNARDYMFILLPSHPTDMAVPITLESTLDRKK